MKPFFLVALAGLLVLSGPASAKVLDEGQDSGKNARVRLDGSMGKPRKFLVKVTASPRQTFGMTFTMVCTKKGKEVADKGSIVKTVGKKRKSFTLKTYFNKTLTIPDAKSCSISGKGYIEKGDLEVKLVGKKR